ncbi:hypothetical protein CLU79DRAFT_772869 [Phycomyces nitens]|nr:hypothetical protein CLU79DRAFT_772869 [Phycomyces nitens]
MIFKLPLEIISLVASYLSQQDRITCLAICKHWLPVFQRSLWQKISLDDTFLRNIYKTPGPEDIYKTNGFRVQQLKIASKYRVQKQCFVVLQQLFPHIRHLEFLVDVQPGLYTVDMFDWSIWKSLTRLDLPLDDSIRAFGPEATFEKLSSLKFLARFNMISDSNNNSYPCFTWQNFEALHRYLPRLECIKSNYSVANISSSDLKAIKRIIPAVTVKKLRCQNNFANFNIHWVLYYGFKYPSLETLSFKIVTGRQRMPLPNLNFLTLEISKYPDMFCFLRTLETIGSADYAENTLPLYYVLKKSKSPIEKLSINFHTFQQGDQLFKDAIDLTSNHTTMLKYFELSLIVANHPVDGLPIRMIKYPVLVSLDITLSGCSIQIDHILDQCPLLKSFKVKGLDVSLGQYNSPSPHGLRDLDIDCQKIGNDIMSYVSFRCRDLRRLKLNARILKDRRIDRCFHIFDMSYTRLDELVISILVILSVDCQLYFTEETDGRARNNNVTAIPTTQDPQAQEIRSRCYALEKIKYFGIPEMLRTVELSSQDVGKIQKIYHKQALITRFPEKGYEKEYPSMSEDYLRQFINGGYLIFKLRSVKNCRFQPYEL